MTDCIVSGGWKWPSCLAQCNLLQSDPLVHDLAPTYGVGQADHLWPVEEARSTELFVFI